MVYSRKKILRNTYEPAKKRQKAQNANAQEKRTFSPTIREEESRPFSLVDVASKAAGVLRSTQRDVDVSEITELGPNTMYWQRLPSQSFSFASGEILTVQECITNAAIYRNKAVRTTGLFIRRDLENVKGRVLLKLRHPIQAKTLKSNGNVSGGLRSQLSTPRSKMSLKSCLVDCNRKQPLVRRKFSSVANKVSQTNRLPLNKCNEPLLAVEVDPTFPGFGSLVAGSTMIMVIGILREDGTVLSRIVRRLEHFDPARHIQCLNVRRRMIYKKHLQQSGQVSSSVLGDNHTSLIHGCGPPPYYSFV